MSASPENCIYLTLEQVMRIHSVVIEEFGGSGGIRDIRLLESAIAAPQASAFGQSVFADAMEIGAAYLFYICRNHPFLDGNKRAAMMSAIVFLRLNGFQTAPDGEAWEQLVLDVAASRIGRDEATARLRGLIHDGH